MLSQCANRIADVLSNNKIIKPEDKEIYVYGLDALISTAINLALIAALGIVLGVFAETTVFVLAFGVLRVYAGGYHAKTHLGCTVAFITAYLVSMAVIFFTPDDLIRILAMVFAFASMAFVFATAPIEHKNRPFEGDERQKFRRNSRIAASLETLIILCGTVIIPIDCRLVYSISVAMVNVVLILILAQK